MADWLRNHLPNRQSPRLWVESLWLLESRDPLQVIRAVQLRQGLNVVWAREPDHNGQTGFAGFGHGVGKTSLCLLLRYCLGDDAPSINALCEKAVAGFPMGGVAAKVHLDDETWTVFRPFGRGGQSFAGLGDGLDSLLDGSLRGDFKDYMERLECAFVGRLSVNTLPGSSQVLEWSHLLAWCVRDQKTRFDAFFHWRDGEGLGFRRPRQDPPLFVRSILGLLDGAHDVLMREVESLQSRLMSLDERVSELEHFPAYELRAAERQLRARLGVLEDVPYFRGTLETSLEELVGTRLQQSAAARTAVEDELESAENGLATELAALSDLKAKLEIDETELGIQQAILDGNEADFRRLSNELLELARLVGKCRHGDVDYAECEHIAARRQAVSLPWHMKKQAAAANREKCLGEVERWKRAVDASQVVLNAQQKVVNRLRAGMKGMQVRLATECNDHDSLKAQWDDLLSLRAQLEDGSSSKELQETNRRRVTIAEDLARKRAELMARGMHGSVRGESLKALVCSIASRILGDDGFCGFNPDSDARPFELHVGGEAYQVLEILLGDVAVLLDSAMSECSLHPGLVVHDCPREADMSESLYQEFLLMVMEAEEQLTRSGSVPFQYIVTTTSPPPPALCVGPFLRLELRPNSEDGLLFKRRLVPSLPGF